MSEVARMRLGAVTVLLAPLVAVVGQSVLPIFDATERRPAFAAAAAAVPGRWEWGWLLSAVAIGLSVVSLFAVRSFLRSAGDNLWSVLAVPLGTVGRERAEDLLQSMGEES